MKRNYEVIFDRQGYYIEIIGYKWKKSCKVYNSFNKLINTEQINLDDIFEPPSSIFWYSNCVNIRIESSILLKVIKLLESKDVTVLKMGIDILLSNKI